MTKPTYSAVGIETDTINSQLSAQVVPVIGKRLCCASILWHHLNEVTSKNCPIN